MNLLIGIWITISIVAAFLVPEVRELQATPIAFFHVPMAITMFGCFFAAAFAGIAWLRTRDENGTPGHWRGAKSGLPPVASRF